MTERLSPSLLFLVRESLVNIAHFRRINELGPWTIDRVMCRCLELDCGSPLQIELTRSKKIAHIFPERYGAMNLTYSMSLVYQRLEPS
jgi:hypothetical protein